MKLDLTVEGPISESNSIFTASLNGVKEVNIDLDKMTFINSIGVKNWVSLMTRLPPRTQVSLYNCPLVMINQVSMVKGFLPENGFVQSFKAPYHCDSCRAEEILLAIRGEDYEYASSNGGEVKVNLLEEKPCPKCGQEMSLDFSIAKTLAFLKV